MEKRNWDKLLQELKEVPSKNQRAACGKKAGAMGGRKNQPYKRQEKYPDAVKLDQDPDYEREEQDMDLFMEETHPDFPGE